MPVLTFPSYVKLTLMRVLDKTRLERSAAQPQQKFSLCKFIRTADDNTIILEGICAEQLEAIVAEIRHALSIPLTTAVPQIAYRETITCSTTINYSLKHPSGSTVQFVQLTLQFDPVDSSSGFVFKNTVTGLVGENASAIATGIEHAKEQGTVSGFPCIGLQVTLEHYSCSAGLPTYAIAHAAQTAFLEGFNQAKPVILQPIMRIRIGIPLKYKDSILEDLAQGSCNIHNIIESDQDDLIKALIVDASIPLVEMTGFTPWLATHTRGLGRYDTQLESYAPISGASIPDDRFPSTAAMRQIPYPSTKMEGNSGNSR